MHTIAAIATSYCMLVANTTNFRIRTMAADTTDYRIRMVEAITTSYRIRTMAADTNNTGSEHSQVTARLTGRPSPLDNRIVLTSPIYQREGPA